MISAFCWITTLYSLLLGPSALAFEIPTLSSPVIDQAKLIRPSDSHKINQLIRRYHQSGRAQIQVLTLHSLDGQSIEQASIKIVDRWKLGSAQKDNGLLLLVAAQERRVRIEVGQGLEGDIPDVIAKRIVEDIIIPNFRQGEYSQGIVSGVHEIIHRLDAQLIPSSQFQQRPSHSRRSPPGFFLLVFIILALIFLSRLGSAIGRIHYAHRGGIFSSTRKGHWGSSGWGGGGFGSGGGNSWSGGGGGFSGGGASGGW